MVLSLSDMFWCEQTSLSLLTINSNISFIFYMKRKPKQCIFYFYAWVHRRDTAGRWITHISMKREFNWICVCSTRISIRVDGPDLHASEQVCVLSHQLWEFYWLWREQRLMHLVKRGANQKGRLHNDMDAVVLIFELCSRIDTSLYSNLNKYVPWAGRFLLTG